MQPSEKPSLDLGKFVSLRPRADGTYRVLFELPPRLRPSGWSATTPLPILGLRTGNLADADEVERIRADAARLYKDYLAATGKGGEVDPRSSARDLAACVRFWQSSQEWKDNKPRTNKGYVASTRIILRWAKALGNPWVDRVTIQDVEQFLGVYDDRPTQRYQLRQALALIFKHAVRAKWRDDNPAREIVVKQPKTQVALWTAADVKRHADHYAQLGHKGVAAMILTEWEIGQRVTDLLTFRHGAEYRNGVFRFAQSKTDQPVVIPVSQSLQAAIEAARIEDSMYLFHDHLQDGTSHPFPDVDRLGHVFGDNRPQGSSLWLRALRHTCVVELARAGCEIPEICSITGHTLQSAHRILQTYLPRDSTVASNAQRKRGLI